MGHLFFIFELAFVSFIGQAHARDVYKVNLSHQAKVYVVTPQGLNLVKEAKSGEIVELENQQVYWLQSPGKVPLLMIPATSKKETAPIQFVDVADLRSEDSEKIIGESVDEIVSVALKVDNYIREKNLNAAHEVLSAAEKKYPVVTALQMKRALVSFLRGDFGTSRVALDYVLKRDPTNTQAKALMNAMDKKNQGASR